MVHDKASVAAGDDAAAATAAAAAAAAATAAALAAADVAADEEGANAGADAEGAAAQVPTVDAKSPEEVLTTRTPGDDAGGDLALASVPRWVTLPLDGRSTRVGLLRLWDLAEPFRKEVARAFVVGWCRLTPGCPRADPRLPPC